MIAPMPTDLPQPPEPPPGAQPGSEPRGRGIRPAAGDDAVKPPPLQSIFAFITLAALATLVLLPILGRRGGRAEAWTVAIMPVRVEAAGSLAPQHLEQLRVALLDAAERHLSGREGLLWVSAASRQPDGASPVDDATLGAGDGVAVADLARAAGADEALVLTLACDSVCRGAVRRLRAIDASTTWQRPRFVLPFEDLTQVEEVLGDHLDVAYLKFVRRQGAPQLFARDADYRSFLDVRRQMGSTRSPLRLAEELVAVRDQSPRFFATYLFEAELRAAAGGDDATVTALLLEAHRIAPADPRPLVAAVPRLLRLGRMLEARDLVAELKSLYPKHPDLERLRSILDETPSADSAG